MQGHCIDVGDIHGHLRDTVFVDIPADGLAALEGAGNPDLLSLFVLQQFAGQRTSLAGLAALLPHVEGDGHRPAGGGGVEVVIDRDEEVPCPHVRGAGFRGNLVIGAAEIRFPGRIGHLFGQGLVFARPADGEVPPLRGESRRLIAVAGDSQLPVQAFGQSAGQRGAFLEGDSRDGNERQHVGGAASRMRSMMEPHVNQFLGFPGTPEGGFEYRFGLSHERNDRAVRRLARIHIQHFHAFHGCDRRNDLVDNAFIASFAVVGYAFDDLFHKWLSVYLSKIAICFHNMKHPRGTETQKGRTVSGSVLLSRLKPTLSRPC